MQIRHIKTIIPAGNVPAKITAMAWSPNNQKLAVVGVDRIIYLFDETGEKKDRFTTKPADPKVSKIENINWMIIIFSMIFELQV